MSDLQNPRLIYLKGFLFLLAGVVAGGLLVVRAWDWQVALLLAICIWSFCRFYYFTFYVIQHYVDDKYRFAGLIDFFKYVFWKRSD